MNLEPDLLRILNAGAKVYHSVEKMQGKVHSNNGIDIIVDYGKGKYVSYNLDEFSELLTSDVIVANSRVTLGNGENFKIKPRELVPSMSLPNVNYPESKSSVTLQSTNSPQYQSMPSLATLQPTPPINLEPGYINFPTGRFSAEPKKGYTKVEYRKATEKVTLELTSEQIDALKEMGLMK